MNICPNFITFLYAYMIAGLITMSLFAIDKHLAIIGAKRISEANLLLASLIFGWLGGFLAMKLFRHKTNKPSFILPMLLVSVANITAVFYLNRDFGCS